MYIHTHLHIHDIHTHHIHSYKRIHRYRVYAGYIHTFIHTYIQTCIHTYIRYMHYTYIHDINTYTHTLPYVHTQRSYRMYIGYDIGDLFFDLKTNTDQMRAWFQSQVTIPAQRNGINISLVIMGFWNELKKPGPMFNFLSAAAVADGADYVYRINDDTEFVTPWARMFVRALQELSPMNVGVVGPLCKQGNTRILTHDFVHRFVPVLCMHV
jgi:hypothetical protein